MALLRTVRQIVELTPRRAASLVRAVVELAIARMRLTTRRMRELLGQGQVEDVTQDGLDAVQRALVDDVAFAIPRVAGRVPWRADCLVQALAAERWLRTAGVATRVIVGVKHGAADPLEAHAWLLMGERVVTGGDVSNFEALGRHLPPARVASAR